LHRRARQSSQRRRNSCRQSLANESQFITLRVLEGELVADAESLAIDKEDVLTIWAVIDLATPMV
jgi:hypothetical protein